MLQLATLADRQQRLPVVGGSTLRIPQERAGRGVLQQRVKVGGFCRWRRGMPARAGSGSSAAPTLAIASSGEDFRDSAPAGMPANVGKGRRI